MKHFTDNFEGGVADAWELEPGWLAKPEDSNYVLSGEGHSWARLGIGQDWTNYSLQLRLKLLRGVIHLNYRVSDEGRYFIGFREEGLYLKKESPWGEFFDLATSDSHHDLEVWHDIKIVGKERHLQVYVDENLEIDLADAEPLTHGTIAFETLDDSYVYIDDVSVIIDPGLMLEQIVEANQSLLRYHFRIEYTSGVIYEGQIDLAEGRQYVQIGLTPGIFPLAEIFWDGERGYGRQIQSDIWLRIRGGPFPNYLQSALGLLQESNIISSREEGPFWLVDIKPDRIPLRDDPEKFYYDIFGEPEDPPKKDFLERVIEQSQSLEVSLQMRISREDYFIYGLTIQSQAQEMRSELTAAFAPSQMEIPPIPEEAPQLADPKVEISPEMLLFHLPNIGGWVHKNHCIWAQRSIQLIEEKDAKKQKYTEIYQPPWFGKVLEAYTENVATKLGKPDETKHHPLVLGAYYEDHTGKLPSFYDNWFASDSNYKTNSNYYFKQQGYKRYYHHFGAFSEGLKYKWYFKFEGPAKPVKSGGYYSARDWGYGGGRIKPPDLNRLTFTQAIQQYNRYSMEGKRNAYLMLGHVLHLLQDVGQPDHAKLVDHAGSSMTQADAYDKYSYCWILAAEIALGLCGHESNILCWGPVILTAFGFCDAWKSTKIMGYEKLIEKWSLSKKVEDKIKKTGIPKKPNYDAYFKSMSDFSIGTANKLSLKSPLGCGTLALVPPVPGADPDIDTKDTKQTEPYFKLTEKIVPEIVGLSSGLIQLFYETVNYPPYVERVAIVQWEPGAKPCKFASFKKNKDCRFYDAEWVMSKNKRVLKYLIKTQKLSQDRPAYIFILFGPANTGPKKSGRVMSKTNLRLVGTYPLTGNPIDITVKLTSAKDNDVGQYYWGTFNPHNCSKDPYTLTLIVEGEDNAAHLAQRNPSGTEIDGNPATLAKVDASLPSYPWKDYQPGHDMNHEIKIHPIEWKLLVNPYGLLVIKPPREAEGEVDLERGEAKGEVDLQIKQKALDCQWEPYWGPVTCPVQWELFNQVTKQSDALGRAVTGSWEDFGFTVHLLVQPRQLGKAKLVITRYAEKYTPGRYELKVLYKVGEPQYLWSNIVTILVELL